MIITFLATGIAIGFCIALVIGPIGILCLRRSITEGFIAGFSTFIGAAAADALYSSVAAFGLTAISTHMLHYHIILQSFGGIYLLYLGYSIFQTKAPEQTDDRMPKTTWVENSISTFLLTLTNPITILAFATLFSSTHVVFGNYKDATALVIGVFIGSGTFGTILSITGHTIGKQLTTELLSLVNKISGCIIATFGIIILCRLLFFP